MLCLRDCSSQLQNHNQLKSLNSFRAGHLGFGYDMSSYYFLGAEGRPITEGCQPIGDAVLDLQQYEICSCPGERTALGETFALTSDWARARGRALACLLLLLLCACAQGNYTINLMPVPAIYEDGKLDPFAGEDRNDESRPPGIFYATLRPPASDGGYPFYLDQRGDVLRLGLARVSVGLEEMAWRDAVELTLQKDRPTNYALRVVSIEDYGVLSESVTPFTDSALKSAPEAFGDRRFLESLESELANSRQRDLFIYVHGYRVPFAEPILVAAELWHFLGYEGAFIAFSWPSTPSVWAYFADADTAMVSAHGFRTFLQFLARESSARRISTVTGR